VFRRQAEGLGQALRTRKTDVVHHDLHVDVPVGELLARDVMSSDPIVASPETDVNDLRRMMVETHQRYFPVVSAGTLQGVISFHDVARAVLEEQGFENRMLKAYIRDWPAEG